MANSTSDASRSQRSSESILNKDAIEERVAAGKEAVGDMLQSGKKKVMEWEEGFEDCVKERPMKSILIAIGAGFLVGLFVGRR